MKFITLNSIPLLAFSVRAQSEGSDSSAAVATAPASSDALPNPDLLRNLAMARSMLSQLLQDDIAPGQDAIKVANDLIKEYGCYCYPEGQKTVGSKFNYHGPALDPVDELCRNMFFKQKCFAIDSEDGMYNGNNCATDNRFRWDWDNNTNLPVCGDKTDPNYYNRKPCKMNNCELEREFVIGVANLYKNGYRPDPSFKRMDDNDYQNFCPTANGGGGKARDLACCGVGTSRRTYDTVMKECCKDNNGQESVVKIIGNCA